MSWCRPPKTPHIVLVDNDPSVLQALELLLEDLGDIVTFTNPHQVARMLRTHVPIDLMLVDRDLHDVISGLELCAMARRVRPSMRLIMVSGGAEDTNTQQFCRAHAIPLHSKAAPPHRLRSCVSIVLEQHAT